MKDTLSARVRFGVFELGLTSGELCAGDDRVVLQEQPLQVLRMLVQREGELVTREEIKKKLWPNDTIVEFDHSINAAIKNLRRALGDSADQPKYIETFARRGYRLMVPVERMGAATADSSSGDVSSNHDTPALREQLETFGLIGKRVSHYRVLEVIGGGGMGLVCKAEDLKLGRRVALKFLPEELANDPVALQRFQREAQTTSSLNHPNICTIYEVEEYEAKPFIVMELLEGETLRDRLASAVGAQRAVPIDQLLDIGLQIAAGLQAAHDKGIIHREIKPANIFLTGSGQVKIVDFGIAKLANAIEVVAAVSKNQPDGQAEDANLPPANIAAIGPGLTRTGAAMGTTAYMSPEQVRREILDARTDLFSFGLVLYEMATGQRAFGGETAEIVHDAILHQPQIPIHDLNSKLPPKLETIINKALEKDRERRYQSAAEMRADLAAATSSPSAAAGSRRRKASLIGIAAVIAAFAAAASLGAYKLLHRSPLLPDTRNMTITLLTDHGQAVGNAGISPDGRLLAYGRREGERSLRVKQVAGGSEVTVVPAHTGSFGPGPTFTPDGNYLYYIHQDPANGEIFNVYSVPALGGTSRQIVSDVASAVTFSPDGKRMAYVRILPQEGVDQLIVANADGSSEQVIFQRQGGQNGNSTDPSWSASNNLIALGSLEIGKTGSIVVLTPEGKVVKNFPLPLLIGGVAWAPGLSGLFLIGRGKTTGSHQQIWFQPYPAGQPVKVSNDLSEYQSLSVTADGQSFVTTEERPSAAIYVADSPAILDDKIDWKLTPISNERATGYQISWTAAGKLLQRDAGRHSYETAADGSGRVDLLNRAEITFAPTACGAGDLVVLSRVRGRTARRASGA